MLFIHFQLGPHRYALAARTVVEVLPLVDLKPVPHGPDGLAGLFNFRGQPVPALDLCALTLGRPARAHLSTRILIVQQPGAGQPPRGEDRKPTSDRRPATLESVPLIGLIAERVAGTLRRDEMDFVNVGGDMVTAPFVGPVLMDAHGIIQILDAQKLLRTEVRHLQATHFPEASDAPH